jgi:hypothetical protein
MTRENLRAILQEALDITKDISDDIDFDAGLAGYKQ